MKKTTKVLAVILSVLMALSLIPIAAFAAEGDADVSDPRVAGWKANYQLLLDTITDDSHFISWEYADQNTKALNTTMNVYTAFALYDSAWRNYATKNVSVDNAKKVLLALIEKAEYNFDDGYVDEIVKVLDTATDVNDFIQKVNKYVNIELFASEGWGTAFEVIGDVAKIAHAYQTYRDQFIEAYANVLSVQKANGYYLDLLQYVADNTTYGVLKTAAEDLIADINTSMEDVIAQLVADIAADGAEMGVDYLINFAMNSNVYTAAVLKIYGVAKSVADVLWNTGDQYNLIDTLMTTYYFQDLASDWTAAAIAGDDDDKTMIAVDMMLTTRAICEKNLHDLKLAENEGIINAIKNKVYGEVYDNIEINLTAIDVMRSILFDTAVEDFKQIVRALYIYCPVTVRIRNAKNGLLAIVNDGEETMFSNDSGVYASAYSEYSKEYLKVAYLYNASKVELKGTKDGYVTLKMDVPGNDWSFTDVAVAAGTVIAFDTDFAGTPTYTVDNGAAVAFNDDFVASEHKEVTVKDVVNATTEVAKEKSKSFFGDFFKKFFESIKNAFKNLFRKK
ncbi:MAG: hypothetical protein IJJ85_05610 [Clostridia bacterium]|nr:hypothetical protein [Clostridia bacterium]